MAQDSFSLGRCTGAVLRYARSMARRVSRMPSGCRRWLAVPTLLLILGAVIFVAPLRETHVLTDGAGNQVYVIDGDSLRIGSRTVRLAGIDAVELRQLCAMPDGGQWSCGVEARAALQALVARGALVCETHASDRYGRAVARCHAQGAPDIAAQLVAQGWALGDATRNLSRYRVGEGSDYLAQEQEAKAARRGIWRGPFQRPADWRAAHPRESD